MNDKSKGLLEPHVEGVEGVQGVQRVQEEKLSEKEQQYLEETLKRITKYYNENISIINSYPEDIKKNEELIKKTNGDI